MLRTVPASLNYMGKRGKRKPVFVIQGDPENLPAVWILAKNLDDAMQVANGGEGISQNALSKIAKVAQTSIGYMLKPNSRPQGDKSKSSSPTIDKIERVARALNLEAWQLLHPNPAEAPLSARQRRLFEDLKSNMSWIKGRVEKAQEPQ